jgi:hypothetical protein
MEGDLYEGHKRWRVIDMDKKDKANVIMSKDVARLFLAKIASQSVCLTVFFIGGDQSKAYKRFLEFVVTLYADMIKLRQEGEQITVICLDPDVADEIRDYCVKHDLDCTDM